ncbi:FAD binding domain-containing protein [Nakamurella sp.]|uniref:FAD binding domain-containing protein n=1 Tax=Nakamurella sp. TaxID=1869182 RepID=UPI003783289C
MKPAPFAWHGPEQVGAAVALLAEHGSAAKVLAGGQSLVPLLAMRLTQPAHLIDINRIAELDTVTVDDGVRIGALARHRRVERDDAVHRTQPLLRQALRFVAHPTIRNRGTCVGSLAHADPAGELTAVLAVCGGSVTLRSATGTRTVPAADFFLGPLSCVLAADELAVSARFPALPGNAGTAFVEIARRHGDYALCGVAAVAELGPDGELTRLRCGYLSVADVPMVLDLTDAWRSGPPDAAAQAHDAVDPVTDLHATADYRRHLARILTVRAAAEAIAHARQRVAAG